MEEARMDAGRPRAARVPVAVADDRALGVPFDYADAFTIALSEADDRTAERFARDALEAAPPPLRWLVWNVFRFVLGFELGPRESPRHVLGWTVVSSSDDLVRLEARSRRFSAVLLGSRPDPHTAKVITAVAFGSSSSRALWALVAPVHRQVARVLLRHASSRGWSPSVGGA
jgi:hypothetical protein